MDTTDLPLLLAIRLGCEEHMSTLHMKKLMFLWVLVCCYLMLFISCEMFFDEEVKAVISLESDVVKRGDPVRFDIGDSGLIWSMDSVSYEWSLLSKPAGSSLDASTAIQNKHGKNASFTTDSAGLYQVGLRVTVGTQSSQTQAYVDVKEVPGVPTGLSVGSATTSNLTIGWSPDSWANRYEVKRYHLASADTEGSVVYVGSDTTLVDGSLQSGTHYGYTVRSLNEIGASPASAQVTGATLVGSGNVPGAPTGLALVSATDDTVSLSWLTLSGVTYNIYRATTVDASPYTLVASGIGVGSYTDTSLSAGTTYFYKVSGTNSAGNGSLSTPLEVVTSCLPPANLTVNTGSPATTSLNITWNASVGADGYKLYRSSSLAGPFTLIHTTTAYAYTDTNLTSNTDYYYKVTAMLGEQESIASSVVFKRTAVETLIVLEASPSSGGSVSGSGSFAAGSVQTISATPSAGWEFVKWDDENTSASRDVTLAVGTNTYSAIFQRVLFSETFESPGWETVSTDLVGPWVVVNDTSHPDYKWKRSSLVRNTGSFGLSSNGDYAAYRENIDTTISRTIDLRAFSSASINFSYWMNTEAGFDTFSVSIRTADQTGTVLGDQSGEIAAWQTVTRALDSYCGKEATLTFTFHSDESGYPSIAPTLIGVWLDDIKVVAR